MSGYKKYCIKCGHGVAGIRRPVKATRCSGCGGILTPFRRGTLLVFALLVLVVGIVVFENVF